MVVILILEVVVLSGNNVRYEVNNGGVTFIGPYKSYYMPLERLMDEQAAAEIEREFGIDARYVVESARGYLREILYNRGKSSV